MNTEIITIGLTNAEPSPDDKINSGRHFLSHELTAYGLEVAHRTTVSDDPACLRDALNTALGRSELIIFCSGYDEESEKAADIRVRDTICEELGISLVLDEESWERIREYYLNTCLEMPQEIQTQAMLPQGCSVFPNDHGITPGCAFVHGGKQILILPGAPSELFPMFSDYIAPYLSNLLGGTIVSHTVGVFGLSETVMNERLADLMSGSNPSVLSYAKDGEAILRITAHAADRPAAQALCDPVLEELKRRIGINIYGIDVGSLQKAVVVLLLDKHMKIATAESCTAGLLSGRLTQISGVSAVFECGVAAYSPEIKHNILGVPTEMLERCGAVSPEVATAMAVGVRHVGNASLGVSITGVAGPDPSEGKPVGTVYIALADEKRVWVKKIDIGSLNGSVDRESIRMLATSHALDLVRRYMEALPTVMAGGELLAPETHPVPVIPQGKAKREHVHLKRFLPWKGDDKSEILRKSAILLGFLILLASLFAFIYIRLLSPMSDENLYEQLIGLYDTTASAVQADATVDYPQNMLTQFTALYARNSDVRGWIKIDNTSINYPVMLDVGNKYYEYHNFNKQYSYFGVPYFDKSAALVSADSVNRSLVIYGSNLNNGQMFSDLTGYYNNTQYLSSHPVIEMNTIYQSAKWKIFSVMVLTTPDGKAGTFNYLQNIFTDESDFLAFAGKLSARSLYMVSSGQVNVQEGDSLLLLSTNFENIAGFSGARLVVAARKVRDGESVGSKLTDIKLNSQVIMPSEWTKGRSTSTNGSQSFTKTSAFGQNTINNMDGSAKSGQNGSVKTTQQTSTSTKTDTATTHSSHTGSTTTTKAASSTSPSSTTSAAAFLTAPTTTLAETGAGS